MSASIAPRATGEHEAQRVFFSKCVLAISDYSIGTFTPLFFANAFASS
jgi:hypothetical protein